MYGAKCKLEFPFSLFVVLLRQGDLGQSSPSECDANSAAISPARGA